MFELLLTACLAADPAVCRSDRHPVGPDPAACRAAAPGLIAALPGGWQAQDWPCVAAGETPAFPVTEVAPGVWVHKGAHAETSPDNGGDIANIGFVIGEDAVAAIDAGSTTAIAEALIAAIRARTDRPIRWLALTHMHPDHTLGAAAFVAAGARVIGHERLGAALAARAETYARAQERLLGAPAAPVVRPDESVADARALDLGGRRLILEAHPTAHTDNDLTVLDEATGTWFLGDLVFLGHMPTLDGSIVGWTRTLDRLSARRVARIVPGHGPVAAAWPEAAGPTRAYLDRLAGGARAAIAAGEPMLGATARLGRETAAGWLLADLFAERNATAAYQELEWE